MIYAVGCILTEVSLSRGDTHKFWSRPNHYSSEHSLALTKLRYVASTLRSICVTLLTIIWRKHRGLHARRRKCKRFNWYMGGGVGKHQTCISVNIPCFCLLMCIQACGLGCSSVVTALLYCRWLLRRPSSLSSSIDPSITSNSISEPQIDRY